MKSILGRPERTDRLGRFARGEAGGSIPIALTFLTLMLMMGGLAVDLMRFEATRTRLQNTSDRAVLAAASLRQKLEPREVVEDYFRKADLFEKLVNINPTHTINAKTVEVDAAADVPPYFIQMLGIDEMEAPANSIATERITDVEISLVLDISGSMGSYSRIENLRAAATEFVDTVMSGSSPGRTTISIVPYTGHVNLGAALAAKYNIPLKHTKSYCVDLPATAFNSFGVSRTTAMNQAGHFDPYTGSGTREASRYFCPVGPGDTITTISDNTEALKLAVAGLTDNDNTSIDIGMKWGAALLEKSAQGVVSGTHSNRPFDPTTREVLKIIVLMTDGENTTEYVLNSTYAGTNLSNIWRRASDGKLSAYYNRSNTSNDYYSPDTGSWTAAPFTSMTGVTNLTWQDVWRYASVGYVAKKLYADPKGESESTWLSNFRTTVSASTKNTRLNNICTATKNAGVIVYGIGLEAPTAGATVIKKCVTSAGHYFDVKGLEIATAFRVIASQINHLRLTQ